MAHAHVSHMPARLDATSPPSGPRSQVVKRRRVLVACLVLMLLLVGVIANYAPLHSYLDARSRLETANAAVEQLSAQKAALQTELGRLSQADYLESLARQDLSYTRPGEELYIVTGTSSGSDSNADTGDAGATGNDTSQAGATTGSGSPGFLERVLAPILD